MHKTVPQPTIRPRRISTHMAWLRREESTRSVALLRIGLAILLWSEFASKLSAYRQLDPIHFVFGLVFFLASLAMAFGYKSQLSTATVGILMLVAYYYFGIELGQRRVFVHHHSYLLAFSTTLLALTPCGRSFSWDRWQALKKAELKDLNAPKELGPIWAIKLMALQLSLVYFWGAVDKSTWASISGVRFEHMFIQFYGSHEGTSFFLFPALLMILGTGTVVFEYIMAFGLWLPRLHPFLIPTGVLFHLGIYYAVPVGSFSVLSCLLYLTFIPSAKIHNFVDIMVAKQVDLKSTKAIGY